MGNISMFNQKSALLFLFITMLLSSCYNPGNEKTSEVKSTQQKVEETLFDDPNELISALSQNGIGQLKEWKNPFDMGWGSLTDYYQFGQQKDGVGLQNNIAYYIEGTESSATKVTINLNVNNPNEKKTALLFLSELTDKTFTTLDISLPKELTSAILKSETYKAEVGNFVITNELDKSKIETWKVSIQRK